EIDMPFEVEVGDAGSPEHLAAELSSLR
ncbi:MAG: hypothetical protein RL093_345, partial [Pseudomonadota bacterium]